jgi:hypothetical protein
MKKISFIVFLLLSVFNSEAQNNTDREPDLQDAYDKVINDKSTESWSLFFNLFPSTFEKFDSIFGYQENQKGPLYDMYQQYIYLFFEAQNHINESVYYNKLIQIAKDGIWDADANSLFRLCIVNLVINDSTNHQKNSFLETLSTYSETDISNFWRFYFEDLYPDCYGEKYKRTVSVLQGYERLILIMEKRYKTICKNSNR